MTVVFADLAASTELATRLDPEELRGVLQPFFRAMKEEVERHGGTIEKFIGDAVVAVFGYPAAHDDDPERAVRAALAMQVRMPKLRAGRADEAALLTLRVAVNTGDVLAAHGAAHEGFVTGDAVNLASRLQAVAPAGSVVVGERTYRSTRHAIAYQAREDVPVKGVERPVPMWEVVAGAPQPAESFGADAPIVGRERELALLAAVLDRAADEGSAALVSIVGPPGMGKSRLANEFATNAGTSARVVRARCQPFGGGIGYSPLAAILWDDAAILESDPTSTVEAKARAVVQPRFGGVDAERTTDVLLSSIGTMTGTDPLIGLEASAARRAIAAAWRRYLGSITRTAPLVVVLEDIHWAEASLLELLESLAAGVSGPLVLVCTARPEIFERRASWGGGLANASSISLRRLSIMEGEALIGHLLGGPPPPQVVGPLLGRSEGNPFFVGELLRMVVEDGTLRRDPGGWTLTREVPTELPDTVQGVIASRLDLLPAEQKRVVQDAAVVGRIFWAGAIVRLGGPVALAALPELLDKGLIRERDSSAVEGERELIFNHILIRDVAYASVPRRRRREAHGEVVAWLEAVARGRDETLSEALWYQASEAGDDRRSARYAMLAGHRHRRVFAADDALRWYDRAVDALDAMPPDDASLPLIETTLSRAEAAVQLGHLEAARADCERALAAARTRPPGSREWLEGRALAALVEVLWAEERYDDAEALLPEALLAARDQLADDLIGRLLCGTGRVALDRGRPTEALSRFEEALAVAEDAEDREGQALARMGLMEVRLAVGPFEDGLDQGRRAEALLRALGQRPLVHRAERTMAALHWLEGRYAEARDLAEAAVTGGRDVGTRADLSGALSVLGLADLALGDIEGARRSADEAVAIALELGSTRLELTVRAARVVVLAELGARDPLAVDVEAGLAASATLGRPAMARPFLAGRAWLEARDGDVPAARETLAAAAELGSDDRLAEALADRVAVLVLGASGMSEARAQA